MEAATVRETKRVEWVGLASPFAYPEVQRMLAVTPRTREERRDQKLYRAEVTKQERKRQMQGFARVPGRSQLTLGPQHGLGATYVWGPRSFVVDMDPADIEILMKLHPQHCLAFRVHPDILAVR